MGERLSSPWTTWYRLLPGLLSSAFGVATLAIFLRAPASSDWLGPFLATVACLALFFYARRLTIVGLLDHCLIVTNGKTRAHVPVSRILSVAQTHWRHPAVVTVTLRQTGRAKPIAFIPKGFMAHTLDDGPITDRLRALAENDSSLGCEHVTER